MGSNAYFRVSDGRRSYPVVFVFANENDTVAYVERWSRARDEMYSMGKPLFISLKVFNGYTNYATKVDSWHQYAPCELDTSDGLEGYELQPGYSAFASPGYWEYPELETNRGTDRPCTFLERNVDRFRSAVGRMSEQTRDEATFLLIESFNEFHEGSQVEPSLPINHLEIRFTQAGRSNGTTFLDILRDRPQPSSASPWIYVLVAVLLVIVAITVVLFLRRKPFSVSS